MKYRIHRIVYPEGENREIDHSLRFNQMVDLNGFPIRLPLVSAKTIVYRVYRIDTESNRNEDITNYHLELLWREELEEYVRR